jgi:hypothetical protein
VIPEGIHERLAEIYDEFDRHSRITNTKYSIDADYFNMQGYRVIDCPDFMGFLRHVSNFVKDKDIDMEIDGSPFHYNDLDTPGFQFAKTEEPMFKFTISALQEDEMLNEKQYKDPTSSHTRQQAQHPSSFRPNKPGIGQYGNGKKNEKNGKKKKEEKTLSAGKFSDKLTDALSENMDIQFSEPEILFTQDQHNGDIDPCVSLENAKQSLYSALDQYHYSLKNAEGPMIDHLNSMINNCTSQISDIDSILGECNDRSS